MTAEVEASSRAVDFRGGWGRAAAKWSTVATVLYCVYASEVEICGMVSSGRTGSGTPIMVHGM